MQGLQQKRILQALRYRVAHFSTISSDEVMEYCADLSEDKMSVAIDALGKISPWKEAWSIEAKILTIWEDATIVNENMQKLLHMVLMDKQHHKIQATVEDNLITSFIDQLKEGEVFIISDFKVIPNRGLVRVQDIDFASFSNFVGVLCGLKKRRDVECNGKILKVLTLEVFADGKKISCNFVGDCPALIDMNSLKRYQRPPAVILQSFKIKVNRDKVSLQNVINISRVLINPDMQKIVNFLNHYRIKILVEDCTSSGMFVLLDSPATKLLGRTCSDMFLLLEDEIDDVSFDSAFSPIFEDFSRYGQLRSYENQLIFGVPIQPHSIKEMLADILCAKIYSSASRNDQICFLIGEIIDVLKHQKVECVDAIGRYRIKIIVSHSNGRNIFILEDDESTNDYTVSNGIISQLMNKKIVLIVDPRPVGYELNTSLHVVRAVCDDVEIVKFLKDSSHDNQQQKFDLDPFVPHFPFKFKNPVQFHSNASIQCSSSSSPTMG
ncbi:Replication factor-A carboxy-terminal domain protein [Arachis hypogaea]|nr:Replication factor-A carboxy-terminal domain protein [Arachis hypogaea]